MGKRASWFSAIKRIFCSHPKESSDNKKRIKDKKKGPGRLRHGGNSNSFFPLFRKPSSIEKILDEAERDHNLIFRPPTPPEPPTPPPFALPTTEIASPRVITSPGSASPRDIPPRAASSTTPVLPQNAQGEKQIYHRTEASTSNCHTSAIIIQTAYRGYVARRRLRALKGLVRLEGVTRGQSVKQQTASALKCMQQVVRVQSQIQSQRIQMLERYKNNKQVGSQLGKWIPAFEPGNENWDNSLVPKEEREVRLQRKVEAAINRERAMSYSYSHQQSWRSAPKSNRNNGFPWWCHWLDRHLPSVAAPEAQASNKFQLTSPRLHTGLKPSPRPSSSNRRLQRRFTLDNGDTPTPRSTRSAMCNSTREANKTPQANNKYTRGKSAFELALEDDESLTSCPPFSVPNYMTPTASAKAKAKLRVNSNPKERLSCVGTPRSSSSEKRRISFPMMTIGSSQRGVLDHYKQLRSVPSVGNSSLVDSTVSMPASAIARKPFNRFV